MTDRPVRRLADWDDEQLQSVAAEYGTPTYLIDTDRVRANYRRLAEAFERAFPEPAVAYAVKANSSPAVLDAVLDAGGHLECASRGELQRVLAAGADPNTVRYTAVNPPGADLDAISRVAADAPGLTVIAGARDTVERLRSRGFTGRVGLRVNPGIGTGHHEAVATGKDAQFGVPADRAPAVADWIRDGPCSLVGVHAHVGSGVLPEELDDHCRAVSRVADIARDIGTSDLSFLDVGGGFGVPYHPDDEPLAPARVARRFRAATGEIDARLVVEPGRYVVADAGVLLGRVNTVKPTPSTRVVGCDASLTQLVRPAMFDAYHPIRNVSAPDRDRTDCTVGGPCCTSADTFCTARPLARPDRGDLLAVGMAGAYGHELASRFHARPRPTEVALVGGDSRVARAGESVAELTNAEPTDASVVLGHE